MHPPLYWEPEVSGVQAVSVQQYGSAPFAWQGTAPTLPAADAVAGT